MVFNFGLCCYSLFYNGSKKEKALFEFTTSANAQVLNLNIYNLPDKNLFFQIEKIAFSRRKAGHLAILLSLLLASQLLFNNDARTGPAPGHPNLTGEKIEDATIPNPNADGLVAVPIGPWPNPWTPSLPVCW